MTDSDRKSCFKLISTDGSREGERRGKGRWRGGRGREGDREREGVWGGVVVVVAMPE